MARSDNILGRVMTPDTPADGEALPPGQYRCERCGQVAWGGDHVCPGPLPAEGEGGWADVQHTDPFFSLPTPNPADGEALAEAIAELRDETTQRWNALDFNGFADPYAGHIATILNAVLSGALIPRPAEPAPADVAAQLAKLRETFCLASPGSDEGFTAWLEGFDAAVAIISATQEART